jgi:hypothetical protein
MRMCFPSKIFTQMPVFSSVVKSYYLIHLLSILSKRVKILMTHVWIIFLLILLLVLLGVLLRLLQVLSWLQEKIWLKTEKI